MTSSVAEIKTQIIDELIDLGAIKFGAFTLKSGLVSPIYIDLRIIVSAPKLLKNIGTDLIEISKDLEFSRIAGLPYTALPIATAFSIESGHPMIYARKEKKEYGTAQQIEGLYTEGEQVLILDDLITKGTSKFEAFEVFESANLKVKDVVVLIDREQGGRELLSQKGYALHSLISVYEILTRIKECGKIDEELYNKVLSFLKETA